MRSVLTLLAVLFLAGPAFGQYTVFRVVNVDSHDVLNVRATANRSSEILGSLSPNAAMIEVFEEEDGWGRNLWEEGSGWVNMGYLAPMSRPTAGEFAAPGTFRCMGTEPFWGAQVGDDGSVTYNDAMSWGEDMSAALVSAQTASARAYPHHYAFEGEVSGTLIIDAARCSDGMSDRTYGWRAYLYARDAEGGERFVEGCCLTPMRN